MNIAFILTLATLLAAGLLGLLFYLRPGWGLGLFIFSLPFERIGSYALNPATGYPLIHPAQIIGAGLIGGLVLRLLARRTQLVLPKSLWFLLAFLGSAFISANLVRVQEVWEIFVWLIFITLLFVTIATLVAKLDKRIVRKALVITALLVSIFGLYQLVGDLVGLPTQATGLRVRYTKEGLGFTRIQGPALEPLYYANYLFLPLFVLLALQVETGFDNKLEGVTTVLVFLNFVLTLSRGAYASGVVGLVVLMVLLRKRFFGWAKKRGPLIAGLILGAVILVLAATTLSVSIAKKGQFSAPTVLKNFLVTKVFETGSFTERVRDQKLALKIFHEHPVFGVGIGGFGAAYYGCKIGKCVYRPNNQALEVLAEGGVVGFTTFHLFLLMLLIYGWRAFRQAEGEQRAMLAGLLAATVAMVVQSQTFSGFLCCLTYTWGTLGLLAGLSTTAKTTKVKGASSR